MSRATDDLPARLRATGATGLERRLLDAASRERPSREALERMARSIGIAAPVVGAAPELSSGSGAEAERAPTVEAGGTGTLAAPKAAVGSSLVLPLVGGALVALVAGVVFATRPSTTVPAPAAAPPAVVQARAVPQASASVPEPGPAGPIRVEGPSADDAPGRVPRSRPATTASLSDQIALVDSARAAVSTGAGERALTLLRQYRDKYPAGSFRPEASVLQIEALVKVGRSAEARALAERFVAEHRGSPLADRAARVAGLPRP